MPRAAEKVGDPNHSARCRLCTANDLEAVIEGMASAMWESRRHGTLDDWPWDEAGSHWQPIYRDLARTAVESLR